MNAQPSSCDALHEPISLLAAGCLPPEEAAAVRGHLAGCPNCAARFAELSAVCGSLERSRAPAYADFDAALRRHHGTATFGASTSQSRPRDLMKEFLQ